MRILWVKAGKLLPVNTGGRIRSYNILKHLTHRHSVTLLSYYSGKRDLDYEKDLIHHFPRAICLHIPRFDRTPLAQRIHYLFHLPRPAPYAVGKHTSPMVRRLIATLISRTQSQVLLCDFLSPTLNVPARLPIPAVLFQHNVESSLWERQARCERTLIKRLAFRIEAWKMLRYEPSAMRRFQHIIAVSENDRQLLSTMVDTSRISITPTGVDTAYFRSNRGTNPSRSLVVFVGSMDWVANIDGVEFFCQHIWPKVAQAVPLARFRIVGRKPPARIKRLASASIEVSGTVSSVVEHFHEAAVVVVPLRIGGGTRLKIYEAMAAGRAVVSTTVGAEGLDIRDGVDVLLADDVSEFANAVIRLLRSPSERTRIAEAAAAAAERFDWSAVAAQFEDTLAGVISKDDGLCYSPAAP